MAAASAVIESLLRDSESPFLSLINGELVQQCIAATLITAESLQRLRENNLELTWTLHYEGQVFEDIGG